MPARHMPRHAVVAVLARHGGGDPTSSDRAAVANHGAGSADGGVRIAAVPDPFGAGAEHTAAVLWRSHAGNVMGGQRAFKRSDAT